MNFLQHISKISAKMPHFVNAARYFKHFQRWPKTKMPFDELPTMWHYVVWSGIENRNNPQWGILADKYAVRAEVERLIGNGHLPELYGHWDNPDNIEWDKLPKSFILKTNNGCGTNIFVHDKSKIDRKDVVKRLKKSLSFPFGDLSGQPHYSLIAPCVIAEEILVQDGGKKSLTDYKIHCVNGEPVAIYIFEDRDEVHHFDFNMRGYTADWKRLPEYGSIKEFENAPVAPERPEILDELFDTARKLSAGHEYVRVDLYYTNGIIYFGELTFTPDTLYHKCYAPYQYMMTHLLDRIKEGRHKLS